MRRGWSPIKNGIRAQIILSHSTLLVYLFTVLSKHPDISHFRSLWFNLWFILWFLVWFIVWFILWFILWFIVSLVESPVGSKDCQEVASKDILLVHGTESPCRTIGMALAWKQHDLFYFFMVYFIIYFMVCLEVCKISYHPCSNVGLQHKLHSRIMWWDLLPKLHTLCNALFHCWGTQESLAEDIPIFPPQASTPIDLAH